MQYGNKSLVDLDNFALTKSLTQESLANRAGLALRHLQKIEAAQVNLTIETLAKIAAALDVDPKELLTEDKGEPLKMNFVLEFSDKMKKYQPDFEITGLLTRDDRIYPFWD